MNNDFDDENTYWYNEPSLVGVIDSVLEELHIDYEHKCTWFKAIIRGITYAISTESDQEKGFKIVVYVGDHITWCKNTRADMVLKGSLESFKKWIESVK